MPNTEYRWLSAVKEQFCPSTRTGMMLPTLNSSPTVNRLIRRCILQASNDTDTKRPTQVPIMKLAVGQSSRRTTYLLLGVRRPLGPVVLVHAPEPDVAVAEGIPPGVEHLAVEAENAFASYACWWWGERGEAVINPRAIRIADTREQVPKGERVALARIHKDDSQQGAALRWCVLGKIKTRERVTKGRRGLFKVRCARANFRAGGADRPGRDEGFVAVELEADPAHGGAQKARAGIVHVQRVDASQIHGDRRRRIHDKLAGRSPDGGANRSALQREPLVAGAIGNQTEARASLDFHTARFIEGDCGPRGIIRFESLSNAQFSNRRVSSDGFPTDARGAFEARHIPGRSQIGERSRAQVQNQRDHC